EGIRAKKASDAQDEDPQGELDRRILAPGHGTSTLSPVPGSLDRARWTGHRALLDEDDAPFSRRIRSGCLYPIRLSTRAGKRNDDPSDRRFMADALGLRGSEFRESHRMPPRAFRRTDRKNADISQSAGTRSAPFFAR